MLFHLFLQNEAQIEPEWPISPDSQLFPSFATEASHFWRNLKTFHLGGGYIDNFLSFFIFSNRFTWKHSKLPTMVNFAKKVA